MERKKEKGKEETQERSGKEKGKGKEETQERKRSRVKEGRSPCLFVCLFVP